MNSTGHAKTTDVAVGVVQREDERVLLARRPTDKPWAGYWEFPEPSAPGQLRSGPEALATMYM
jgi:adenine-specific DNA glycosylase